MIFQTVIDSWGGTIVYCRDADTREIVQVIRYTGIAGNMRSRVVVKL